mmetsp:Transcript_72251/g.120380  ORF Transcript_72251/g.120380 Transcript_72251/m.120380 type:complete len:280 (-) Transcript_72251:39-878(-)
MKTACVSLPTPIPVGAACVFNMLSADTLGALLIRLSAPSLIALAATAHSIRDGSFYEDGTQVLQQAVRDVRTRRIQELQRRVGTVVDVFGQLQVDHCDWSRHGLNMQDALLISSLCMNELRDKVPAVLILEMKSKPAVLPIRKLMGYQQHLQQLDLHGRGIGPLSATVIAKLLKFYGTSLTSLDLSSNMIDNIGGQALGELLAITASLTQLDLSINELCGVDWQGNGTYCADGIKAIADALGVSTSLTSLDVRYNNLDKKSETRLKKGVKGKRGFELKL